MLNTDNYRIKKHQLTYNDDGTPVRKYLNNDPGMPGPDRPGYNDLSVSDTYEGYRDMVWTPLDLPWLDVDIDHVAAVKENIKLKKNFYDTENVGTLVFLKKNCCGMAGENPDWYDFAKIEFPHVVDYIGQLPFKTIHQIFFLQASNAVTVHYDEEKSLMPMLRQQAPSHLHFRWSKVTDWRNEHFYMSKDHGATRVFPMLPPDTNAFAYDGGTYEHGVEKGFAMRERVQLVVHGVYDIPRWHQLLEKSWEKYKDYAITTEHFNQQV
jgi:hypothetical protein